MQDKRIEDAIRYVYNQFLSKAYSDKQYEGNDSAYVTHDGIKIVRPNHGLAHILRTLAYLPHIVAYLQAKYPDHGFDFSKETFEKIQIAKLFWWSVGAVKSAMVMHQKHI